MVQTLDFLLNVWKLESERSRLLACLSCDHECETVIDRHRLSFDPQNQTVTVQRVSDDVPFAWKIPGCRMPYDLLRRLMVKDFEDMTGFEWL